ncbi:MAG: aldo/keto reductase [Treponema sp.]|jgi:methylglyoxal reductase|nr:aldo/keto reductase [Treponema sp.]
MKQMKIGKSGIEASVVGIGAWAIGGDSNWGPSDDAESIRTIHRARELGITLLDTAPAYGLGHSEEVVGKALQGRRADYVLSTKGGLRWDNCEGALLMERDGVRVLRNSRPESLAWELEQSLKRLRTDYIDLYIIHWQAVPEFPVPISDTMGFLLKAKKEGKIRAIGASNLSVENFKDYVAAGQLDLIQEKYSILDRAAGDRFFDLCGRYGVTFQAYSPLERGVLTGKYKPGDPVNMAGAKRNIKWYQPEYLPRIVELTGKWEPLCGKYGCTMTNLVTAWTAAAQGKDSSVSVLIGARTAAQVEENAGGGGLSLEAEDFASMLKDAEAVS